MRGMTKADDTTDENDRARGYERCIVTFVDILGYRELLKTRHSSDILEALRALRKFTRGDGDDEEPPRRSDEFRLYSQAFSESVSDAVVRVRTIDTQSLDGPFLYELLDLMHAQIECVNRGILIRGGMTIGRAHVGLDGRGPIFGEAMVRAYEIEQGEAVHPRLMIDDDAIVAFLTDSSLWQHGQFDGNDAEMARRYIGVSEDGSYFLDYLNAADAGEFDDGEIGRFAFLARHRDVVEEGLISATGKARRKLIWLANYHNRFICGLRSHYDEYDTNGEFEAAMGISPRGMFDGLLGHVDKG
ncbi:MAG TPA: hypothetical protein VFT56_16945 [Sphingomonas sp.]|nr:hypothetical protein [Sphingomonas sp.]